MIKTASDAKSRIGNPHLPTAAPAEFSGTLDQFCSRYVLPNLPAPAVVADFHRQLTAYVRGPDPLLLIRQVTGTERRQEPYSTSDGTRFRATDNSPAWWTHAALLQGCHIAPGAFGDVVATMPIHFHFARKLSARTANEAGWHVAHIFNVKDGDTDYRSWSRAEIIGRFVRNVHPCNYFLIAKNGWERWGGKREVVAFFAAAFAKRYAQVWSEFMELARVNPKSMSLGMEDVAYHYGDEIAGNAEKGREGTGPVAPGDCVARYRSSRLLFRADVIEPLADEDSFCVETPSMTFRMTKEEFYSVFENVVSSASYRERGLYHCSSVPKKALRFVICRSDGSDS